jgi:Ni/Co efflux regulator RcnB
MMFKRALLAASAIALLVLPTLSLAQDNRDPQARSEQKARPADHGGGGKAAGNRPAPSAQSGQAVRDRAPPAPSGQAVRNRAAPSAQSGQAARNRTAPSPPSGQTVHNRAAPSAQSGQAARNRTAPSAPSGQTVRNRAAPTSPNGQVVHNRRAPSAPNDQVVRYRAAPTSPNDQVGRNRTALATPSGQNLRINTAAAVGHLQQRNQWRSSNADWNRNTVWQRDPNWWRRDAAFSVYTGARANYFFAPGFGYYSVPQEYWGERWSTGAYLPLFFLSYAVSGYQDYGLPAPPYNCSWVWVNTSVLLVDRSDGYILDEIDNVW